MQLPLPTREEASGLLHSYFLTVNRLLPIYDKEQYLTLVESQYTGARCNSAILWASFNGVFALGAAYGSGSLSEHYPMSRTYFQRAASVLNQLMLSRPTILGIQTLLTMAVFLLNYRDHHSAGFLVSTAMRSCQSLGLHARSCVRDALSDIRDSEQRVFWVAFVLDQSIAPSVGAMPAQNSNDMVVDLPSMEKEQPMEQPSDEQRQTQHFRQMCELALIRCRVFHQLYSETALQKAPSETYHNIRELNRGLALWKKQNPFLCSHEHGASENIFAITQRLSYCNCLILVNQRYLFCNSIPSIGLEQLELVVELCTEAAWDSIEMIDAAASTRVDYIGVLADYMLSAARTLSNLVLYRSRDVEVERYQRLLEIAYEHIQIYSGARFSVFPVIYSHLTAVLLRLARSM
ncbi:fungal-specific transcription factor domain-containing protein [Aspergillus cavernicola]|uniref:Fungal-specific transcription factor domain-containing protein n=1 Tax=Aspergillus cavernicola TaxID=176166 RepID=A0ABR4I798_9EURO